MTVKEGSRFRKSFAAGMVAGALAIGISLLLRSHTGGPFLPEIASQTLFSLTPGEFESQAVENFGIFYHGNDLPDGFGGSTLILTLLR